MPFYPSQLELGAFGSGAGAGGWLSNDQTPRLVADVALFSSAEIIGFGTDGVYLSLSVSGPFQNVLTAPTLVLAAFGAGMAVGGWTSDDLLPRRVGDINGDGWADIVGFGWNGAYASLSDGQGSFGAVRQVSTEFGAAAAAGEWVSADRNPRMLADVDGDRRADIVGFGDDGVHVSLATAGGTYLPSFLASTAFGADAAAGGWTSNDRYPRMMADVNSDGRADVVGFGEAGVYVALAAPDGSFAAPFLATGEFGAQASSGGWMSDTLFPRMLGSFDVDGVLDIIGFGNDGVFIARGRGDGTFMPASFDMPEFGRSSAAGGWTNNDLFTRHVADVDGDGFDDIVGFGASGVTVALSTIGYWDYW